MRASQPGCRKSMSFVAVHEVKPCVAQYPPQGKYRRESRSRAPHGVDSNTLSLGALCQGRTRRCDQLRNVTLGYQTLDQQQRLVLATPPLLT
jgi:hypothetical protein